MPSGTSPDIFPRGVTATEQPPMIGNPMELPLEKQLTLNALHRNVDGLSLEDCRQQFKDLLTLTFTKDAVVAKLLRTDLTERLHDS